MIVARIGITKKQVEIAKAALLARKEAVTIDAVRQVLGNTGSKTTISRYLNELAEEAREEPDNLNSLSEELGMLVTNIASRLESEAKEIVVQSQVRHHQEVTLWQEKCASLASDVSHYQDQVSSLTAKLSKQESVNHGLEAELNTLKLAHAQLVEKETALHQRLTEKQAHIASLEEKHTHAREALQHFREAAKDQRDKEQTRHEQQLQQAQAELRQAVQANTVKQEELTQQKRDYVQLLGKEEALQNQLKTVTNERDTLANKAVESEKTATECRSYLRLLQQSMTETEKQRAELTQKNTDLTDNLRVQESLNIKLSAKLEAQSIVLKKWDSSQKVNSDDSELVY